MLQGVRRAGPCGTTLATAFGSDLRSVDTLRSSRYALTQPDAFGAGASRDGQAILASVATQPLCKLLTRRRNRNKVRPNIIR